MEFMGRVFELLRPILELILSYATVAVPTIVASYAMGTALAFKMTKDIVDSGYKLSKERLKQLPSNKLTKLVMYIPFINMITALFATMLYINNNSPFIDKFRISDILIPLTEEEKKEYLKKPTLLNALNVTNNKYIDKEIIKVTYIDGDDNSTIYYKIKDGVRRIVKVEGPLSRLSIFEQQIKLNEILEDDAFGFAEKLVSGHYELVLTKDEEKIEEESITSSNEPTLTDTRKQLELLRKDLINQKENMVEERPKVYKKEIK